MENRSGMKSQSALAVLTLAIFLAASCNPVVPRVAEISPTKTEVPPTATASRTPEPTKTPGPTNTPEPREELRTGINTWVDIGNDVSVQFIKAVITDDYNDPAVMGDYHYRIKPGVGQTWIVFEGVWKGDFPGLYPIGREIPKDGMYDKYLTNPDGIKQPVYIVSYAKTVKHRFNYATIIHTTDKPPFTLVDKIHDWKVVFDESLIVTNPTPVPTKKPYIVPTRTP